ncbi:MAG: transporter [Planctomycetes bacterium]|nr:transporter [Planctomycetota bacterium]
MKRLLLLILVCATINALTTENVNAAGISVDAGLTPPEDRWIIRTQFRYMERKDDPTPMNQKMETYTFPIIVAYGLRPDLTLMVRQKVKYRKMSMSGSVSRDTGVGDLFVLGKYRLYRRNTHDYTFGIAPTLGLEFPTGDDDFGSETWDLQPGLFTSWRSGPWASDFSIAYKWNGFADKGRHGLKPGNELSVDLALAHQFSIGGRADTSLTPVLEFNYKNNLSDRLSGQNVSNTGESLFFVSPGLKFTKSSFILEVLLQFPVWQDREGTQPKQGKRLIVGTRFMF